MNSAAGVLYRAGGKVLLMKRRESSVHGGTWGFPAGTIEDGETSEQAAAREFGEETGVPLPASLTHVSDTDGFTLYRADGEQFEPQLNEEHTAFVWADASNMPEPLHPNVAEQLQAVAMDYADVPTYSAREVDENGYVTVRRNPISRAGVFPYKGSSIPGADKNKFYNVYRPAEELSSQETLASLKNLPIIDEHEMLGDEYNRAPEEKGIHGNTTDEVFFEGRDIFSTLRIYSSALKRLIDCGKKGLSLGYRCAYEKSVGVFEGMRYDYIQRDIRGNHLALVTEGRCGTAVLDHSFAMDHFDLALETGEEDMVTKAKANAQDEAAEETTEAEAEKKVAPSLEEVAATLEGILPVIAKINETLSNMGAAKADAASTEASVLDADEAEESGEAKKGEAEDEDEDEKKGDAMDAAEVTKRTKAMLVDFAARDKLVRDLTPHVGTFDHAEMTADEVAAYGAEKLGLDAPKGSERVAISAFIKGKGASEIGYAMDSAAVKTDGLLAKRLGISA